MNILVIGDTFNLQECRMKFGEGHRYIHERGVPQLGASPLVNGVVFDFLQDTPSKRSDVHNQWLSPVFVDICRISLSTFLGRQGSPVTIPVFGFAGLPSFLNREVLEVAVPDGGSLDALERVCKSLGTTFQVVADKAGLVTPRVICMIINEAYSTVEDGTATREDVDLAMKLGTHYPFGPFEWCGKIGIANVCGVLQAAYEESGDERYAVCSLLKKESQAS